MTFNSLKTKSSPLTFTFCFLYMVSNNPSSRRSHCASTSITITFPFSIHGTRYVVTLSVEESMPLHEFTDSFPPTIASYGNLIPDQCYVWPIQALNQSQEASQHLCVPPPLSRCFTTIYWGKVKQSLKDWFIFGAIYITQHTANWRASHRKVVCTPTSKKKHWITESDGVVRIVSGQIHVNTTKS